MSQNIDSQNCRSQNSKDNTGYPVQNFAATLAHSRVEATQNNRHFRSGIPPMTK